MSQADARYYAHRRLLAALPPYVIGPLAGGAAVVSAYDAPQRSYAGSWHASGYGGGMCYADYASANDGSTYYELGLLLRTRTRVDLYFKLDPATGDGGTFRVEVDRQAQASGDSIGAADPADALRATLTLPAGTYRLRLVKTGGRSLYASNMVLTPS